MNKNENRAVIKYFWLKGYRAFEIFEEMRKALGEEMAPSSATVKNWVAEFKRGRLCIEDVKRSGRPKQVTTLDNIVKIEQMVERDPQVKVADIAKAVGLSKERAFNILVKELGMRKRENGWECITSKYDEMDEETLEKRKEREGFVDISVTAALETKGIVEDGKIGSEKITKTLPPTKRNRK